MTREKEREREHQMAGLEMPALTKNGSEHWRCDRLDTPKYTMNSAVSSNSSRTYDTRTTVLTVLCVLREYHCTYGMYSI